MTFNPGSDPFSGEAFELGLLQTGDREFHLFAEYDTIGPDRALLQRWQGWQQACQGTCVVILASGITGNAKGNPGLKDIVGVFETHFVPPKTSSCRRCCFSMLPTGISIRMLG